MKRILLIRHKDFSYIQISVYKILVKYFPEYEVDIFEVNDIHKKISKWLFVLNLFYLLKEYGIDFLLGHKKLKSALIYYKNTQLYTRLYRKYLNEHVLAHNYTFTFQLQTMFDGSTPGVPHFIYTDHITIANYTYPNVNPRQFVRSKAFIEMEKELCWNSMRCFTMSSNISRLMVEKYQVDEEKVKCVFAGNNVNLLYQENKAKYASKNILFVGVNWQRKGGPILLAAFKKVLERVPDAQLTIVGCSPKIKSKNVNVIGRIPPAQLPEFYNNAAVFCLPTLVEPFGIVFIEAMLYRLPVIANKIGALPDFVKDNYNGFLVESNIDLYAEYLIKVIENPELCRNMGENAYEYVKDRYTWDQVGLLIRQNIESVIPL